MKAADYATALGISVEQLKALVMKLVEDPKLDTAFHKLINWSRARGKFTDLEEFARQQHGHKEPDYTEEQKLERRLAAEKAKKEVAPSAF